MMWESKTLGEISLSIQTGPFGSQLHQSDYSDDGTPVVRKLFLFLDENPLTDIISIAMKLNDAQVKNFTLLWMLIRKSDEKSPLFIKNTNSQKNVQERMLKLQLLGVSNKELKEVPNNEL